MGEKPRRAVEINQFPGLVTDTDRHDLPNGAAQVQVNVTSSTGNELNVRRGFRQVNFEVDS